MFDDGAEFGRYRIITQLGQGGMGQVYKAFNTGTNRDVALKVLPSEFAANAEFRERFQREANLVAGLREPHIIPIHDFGEIDGELFLDMRLIDGVDAKSLLLTSGPLDPHRAVNIIDQVAAALDAAHRIDLEHRDIKPANILVADRDFVYLIDFGIARAAGETGLTNTGLAIGTFAYMAPERFSGGQSDYRADIYALACVLYELLTGMSPFPGTSIEQQIAGHLSFPPPSATSRRPDLPLGLDSVIAQGMAKLPENRFRSAGLLAAAARNALNGSTEHTAEHAPDAVTVRRPASQPKRQAPKLLLAGAAVTAVGLVIGGAAWWTSQSGQSTDASIAATNEVQVAPTGNSHGSQTTGTEKANDVEVADFVQIGDNLSVRLHNPNRHAGLIRSPFELAMLDASGNVVATEGQGGVPGALTNTIYQLPPDSDYGLDIILPAGKKVHSVELTVLGTWHDWSSIDPPKVETSNVSIVDQSSTSGPSVTGRLLLNRGGPKNVIVIASVDTPKGTVYPHVVVDCLKDGKARSFQTTSFANVAGPFRINEVVAYPTAVDGVEPTYPARC